MRIIIRLCLAVLSVHLVVGCAFHPKQSDCFLADNWNLSVDTWENWTVSYQTGKNYYLAHVIYNYPNSTNIIFVPGDSLCFKSKAFPNPDQLYSARMLSEFSDSLCVDLEELINKANFVINNNIQMITGVDGSVLIQLMRDKGHFLLKVRNADCIDSVRKKHFHLIDNDWYENRP